jgi:hypothetical protein
MDFGTRFRRRRHQHQLTKTGSFKYTIIIGIYIVAMCVYMCMRVCLLATCDRSILFRVRRDLLFGFLLLISFVACEFGSHSGHLRCLPSLFFFVCDLLVCQLLVDNGDRGFVGVRHQFQ